MYKVTPREDTALQDVLDIAEALGWHDTFPQNVEDGWTPSTCDEAQDAACTYIEQVFERVFDKLFHIKKYV